MTTNLWSGLTHVGTHEYVDEPLAVNWTTKGSLTPVIDQGQCFSTTASCAAFIGNLPLLSERQRVDWDTDDSTGGLMEKNAMSQQRALARLRDAQCLIHRRRHGGWTTFSPRRTPCARSPVAVTKAHGEVSEVAWLVLAFSTTGSLEGARSASRHLQGFELHSAWSIATGNLSPLPTATRSTRLSKLMDNGFALAEKTPCARRGIGQGYKDVSTDSAMKRAKNRELCGVPRSANSAE